MLTALSLGYSDVIPSSVLQQVVWPVNGGPACSYPITRANANYYLIVESSDPVDYPYSIGLAQSVSFQINQTNATYPAPLAFTTSGPYVRYVPSHFTPLHPPAH